MQRIMLQLQYDDNAVTNGMQLPRVTGMIIIIVIVIVHQLEIQADDLVEQTKLVQRSNLYE